MTQDLRGLDVILGRRRQHRRPHLHVVGDVGVEVPSTTWPLVLWGALILGAGWLAFGGKSAYVTPPHGAGGRR